MPLMGIGSALAQYTWKGGNTFDATSWNMLEKLGWNNSNDRNRSRNSEFC